MNDGLDSVRLEKLGPAERTINTLMIIFTFAVFTACGNPSPTHPQGMMDETRIREIVAASLAEQSKQPVVLPDTITELQDVVKSLVGKSNNEYFNAGDKGWTLLSKNRLDVGFSSPQSDCLLGMACLVNLKDTRSVLAGTEITVQVVNPHATDFSDFDVAVCKAQKQLADPEPFPFEGKHKYPFAIIGGGRTFGYEVLGCVGEWEFHAVKSISAGSSTTFKMVFPGDLYEHSGAFGIRFHAKKIIFNQIRNN